MEQIETVKQELLERLKTLDDKKQILRAPELRTLYGAIKNQPADQRAAFRSEERRVGKECRL